MSKNYYPYGKKINAEEVIKAVEMKFCKECDKEVKVIKQVNRLTEYGITITFICPNCGNYVKDDEKKYAWQKEER